MAKEDPQAQTVGVSSVVAGSTYLLHNLTVHKDKFTNEIYLNTAQSGTAINITDDFQDIHVLSVAPQAPAEYLATTDQGSKLTLAIAKCE